MTETRSVNRTRNVARRATRHYTRYPHYLLLFAVLAAQACTAESAREAADTVRDGNNDETRETRILGADTAPPTVPVPGAITLSETTYIVEDTATSAALRLYISNTTDSVSVIDRVDPSCGCIMTTVQRRYARPGDSAEIYIGLIPEQMSTTQPYTVDVYMTHAPTQPLRLTIWKRGAWESRDR